MIRREFVLALILARWAWWRHNDRSLDGLRDRRGGGLHRGILLGPVLGYGLLAIWGLQIIQRGLSSTLFALIWQRRQWTQIRL